MLFKYTAFFFETFNNELGSRQLEAQSFRGGFEFFSLKYYTFNEFYSSLSLDGRYLIANFVIVS
jgi:hypothetical protein